jgi:hypothetical protein
MKTNRLTFKQDIYFKQRNMALLYHMIIKKYIINDVKCHKLLSSDGITSRDLAIEKVGGLLEGITLDTKAEASMLPSIVKASGIAKNLDEYQYIVCFEVRDIPDSNSYKKELQKYRIAIIASFAKLISILLSRSDKDLKNWNYFAQILLTQISEILVNVRLKQDKLDNINKDSLKSTFDYFDLSESDVDRALKSIYC